MKPVAGDRFPVSGSAETTGTGNRQPETDSHRPASGSASPRQPETGNRQPTLRVHLALTTVATLFSANYIVSKLAMNSMAPMTFAYLRVVGAAILLNLLLSRRPQPPLSRGDLKALAGFSMLAVVINQALFLGGLALTNAHIAAILITTIPVFSLATAIGFKLERGTAAKVGGIALAAAGALLVVGGEGIAGSRNSVLGTLMLVGNCLAFALYLVLSKPMMSRLSAVQVVAKMFAFATVLMLPIALPWLLRERWSQLPTSSWIALGAVILGPTVLAYLLIAWTLKHAESSLVAAYTYVQPILTAILAAIFLDEEIHARTILAAAVIFAGVWLAGRPVPPAPVAE